MRSKVAVMFTETRSAVHEVAPTLPSTLSCQTPLAPVPTQRLGTLIFARTLKLRVIAAAVLVLLHSVPLFAVSKGNYNLIKFKSQALGAVAQKRSNALLDRRMGHKKPRERALFCAGAKRV
jgi:hypothetical protein